MGGWYTRRYTGVNPGLRDGKCELLMSLVETLHSTAELRRLEDVELTATPETSGRL
jgi:hypothetical protein